MYLTVEIIYLSIGERPSCQKFQLFVLKNYMLIINMAIIILPTITVVIYIS